MVANIYVPVLVQLLHTFQKVVDLELDSYEATAYISCKLAVNWTNETFIICTPWWFSPNLLPPRVQ